MFVVVRCLLRSLFVILVSVDCYRDLLSAVVDVDVVTVCCCLLFANTIV